MHRWHVQYLGSIELPSHLTELEMESFFTLSHEERTLIQSRYKPNPRIAAANEQPRRKQRGIKTKDNRKSVRPKGRGIGPEEINVSR